MKMLISISLAGELAEDNGKFFMHVEEMTGRQLNAPLTLSLERKEAQSIYLAGDECLLAIDMKELPKALFTEEEAEKIYKLYKV